MKKASTASNLLHVNKLYGRLISGASTMLFEPYGSQATTCTSIYLSKSLPQVKPKWVAAGQPEMEVLDGILFQEDVPTRYVEGGASDEQLLKQLLNNRITLSHYGKGSKHVITDNIFLFQFFDTPEDLTPYPQVLLSNVDLVAAKHTMPTKNILDVPYDDADKVFKEYLGKIHAGSLGDTIRNVRSKFSGTKKKTSGKAYTVSGAYLVKSIDEEGVVHNQYEYVNIYLTKEEHKAYIQVYGQPYSLFKLIDLPFHRLDLSSVDCENEVLTSRNESPLFVWNHRVIQPANIHDSIYGSLVDNTACKDIDEGKAYSSYVIRIYYVDRSSLESYQKTSTLIPLNYIERLPLSNFASHQDHAILRTLNVYLNNITLNLNQIVQESLARVVIYNEPDKLELDTDCGDVVFLVTRRTDPALNAYKVVYEKNDAVQAAIPVLTKMKLTPESTPQSTTVEFEIAGSIPETLRVYLVKSSLPVQDNTYGGKKIVFNMNQGITVGSIFVEVDNIWKVRTVDQAILLQEQLITKEVFKPPVLTLPSNPKMETQYNIDVVYGEINRNEGGIKFEVKSNEGGARSYSLSLSSPATMSVLPYETLNAWLIALGYSKSAFSNFDAENRFGLAIFSNVPCEAPKAIPCVLFQTMDKDTKNIKWDKPITTNQELATWLYKTHGIQGIGLWLLPKYPEVVRDVSIYLKPSKDKMSCTPYFLFEKDRTTLATVVRDEEATLVYSWTRTDILPSCFVNLNRISMNDMVQSGVSCVKTNIAIKLINAPIESNEWKGNVLIRYNSISHMTNLSPPTAALLRSLGSFIACMRTVDDMTVEHPLI